MTTFEQRVATRKAELDAEDARQSVPPPRPDASAEIHFMAAKVASDRARAELADARALQKRFDNEIDLPATLRRKALGNQITDRIYELQLKRTLTEAEKAELDRLQKRWERIR
ncbi:MAG: hypothetical protein EPO32_14835 [Anaerolineae bacterium]|nr:MAG: hypothetical protein EPO32_14835 [Anaerolineae bacterium]